MTNRKVCLQNYMNPILTGLVLCRKDIKLWFVELWSSDFLCWHLDMFFPQFSSDLLSNRDENFSLFVRRHSLELLSSWINDWVYGEASVKPHFIKSVNSLVGHHPSPFIPVEKKAQSLCSVWFKKQNFETFLTSLM